ncbi:MAG TPA: peptide chain release factor 3 [Candidatus Limnocylindria bacterium]|nr:peptide chain release factor 3 [Candidatus Limnocylindria bacterium]
MIQQATGNGKERLAAEVARRRTFAIISHPDAGKTTLTEKLLLYGGAVQMAGAVRAGKNQRHAASDWMTMEQERGISITASALEIEYRGFRINLLDTPGHQDFSEDTYRTLMVADSAVMVLDSAKGIEAQTEKLFRVCRMRRLPILTFINKLDHPGRDPLELLDEIERKLNISTAPMNWPIGAGPEFQGVYDLGRRQVLHFQRTEHSRHRAPLTVHGVNDPALPGLLGEAACKHLRGQVELISDAGTSFDQSRFLGAELTPVFFGSALNNFGVEPFLEALLDLAPAPGVLERDSIDPNDETFTGVVFKIQANMDLRHRDRMAFLRILSGRFEKDMLVYHSRLQRELRLARAYRIFAREREPIEEAFPGDIVGLINPGMFAIGDTVSTGESVELADIPRFMPERFAVLRNQDIGRYKQFNQGLLQLEEEGAIQILHAESAQRREPILAAVGELQFDVVLARLREEYGVRASIDPLPFTCARWIEEEPSVDSMILHSGALLCRDREGRAVMLFTSDWNLDYFRRANPTIAIAEADAAWIADS